MPRSNRESGVSNAGPVEESTVRRADGALEEVHVPGSEESEPEPAEAKAKPARAARGARGGK